MAWRIRKACRWCCERIHLPMQLTQKTQFRSLGQEDPLEEKITHWVFLPEKFHGQRTLVGYTLRGLKESDRTEHVHTPLIPLQSQFSSVAQSCLNLCDPMNCSTSDLPVHHQLPEFTQIHVHWVGDTIQPSHPLSSSSPPALNLSQHKGHVKWVSSLHQMAQELEFQLQYQSLQCIPRTDLL